MFPGVWAKLSVVLRSIISRFRAACELVFFVAVVLAHVAFSVVLFLPTWLLFLLATRLAKLAVAHVPRLARDYKWMASSDALFFLPHMNEATDSGGKVVNQPFIHFTASVDGRVDVDKVRNRFVSYLLASGAAVESLAAAEEVLDETDCAQISEGTKKMYQKFVYYPVSRFGYTFWKRDHDFDLEYHFPALSRYKTLKKKKPSSRNDASCFAWLSFSQHFLFLYSSTQRFVST